MTGTNLDIYTVDPHNLRPHQMISVIRDLQTALTAARDTTVEAKVGKTCFGLTRRQRDCLQALIRLKRRLGIPPSLDELASELGLKSKSGVQRMLTQLEDRGYIRRLHNRARAIEVLVESIA